MVRMPVVVECGPSQGRHAEGTQTGGGTERTPEEERDSRVRLARLDSATTRPS